MIISLAKIKREMKTKLTNNRTRLRLKVAEAIARWNSIRPEGLPKKTLKSVATEALTENSGSAESKYNMIKRMNSGHATAVKLIDIVNICYALETTPSDLIDWKY
jgi:DNA-binding Xre family transcriptional regulator